MRNWIHKALLGGAGSLKIHCLSRLFSRDPWQQGWWYPYRKNPSLGRSTKKLYPTSGAWLPFNPDGSHSATVGLNLAIAPDLEPWCSHSQVPPLHLHEPQPMPQPQGIQTGYTPKDNNNGWLFYLSFLQFWKESLLFQWCFSENITEMSISTHIIFLYFWRAFPWSELFTEFCQSCTGIQFHYLVSY